MHPLILKTLRGAALCAAICTVAAAAHAQYPEKPIRLIIPYGAGGVADPQVRLVAESLREQLGQPVVIENKGGALTAIGHRMISESPPDGYTIGLVTLAAAILPSTLPNYKIDSVTGFSHITQYNYGDYAFVISPKLAANTFQEVVAYAKENPKKFNIAVGGPGLDLAALAIGERAGVRWQTVKYKSQAEVRNALLAGDVEAAMDVPGNAREFAEAGKMKFVATTGDKRSPFAPNVPTVAESGYPGFEAGFWWAFGGPPGMPPAVVSKLNTALRKAIDSPSVQALIRKDGQRSVTGTPEELKRLFASEQKRWGELAFKYNVTQDN